MSESARRVVRIRDDGLAMPLAPAVAPPAPPMADAGGSRNLRPTSQYEDLPRRPSGSATEVVWRR